MIHAFLFISGVLIGDAAQYEYIESKNRYRVTPYEATATILFSPDFSLGALYGCYPQPYGYCMTPRDSDVMDVRTEAGYRDCLEYGTLHKGVGAGESECGELIAYYPLESDTLDYSGNELHGTNHGATWHDNGLYFGGDDWVDLGNPPELNLIDYFTISAWVRLYDINAYQGIVGKMRYDGGMYGWMLYRGETSGFLPPKQFRFTLGDGDWPPWYTESELSFPVIEWHYVVGVVSGLESRVYVNGVEIGCRERPLPIVDSGEPAYIGRQYSYHRDGWLGYLNGFIKEVKIRSWALSPEEVAREYAEGAE